MKDVAQAAGVSQATVSLVLNDVVGSGIADATKMRVRATAELLGYRHNALARNLKLQRSNIIGFVSEQITTSPHAGGLVQGAQDVARAAGKHLVIVNVEFEPGDSHTGAAERAIDDLLELRVDGIVFASMFHRVIEVPANLREANSVLLDASAADGSISSVVPDELQAARRATEILLEAGHRDVIHLSPSVEAPAVELRRQGYRQAVAERGLDGRVVVASDTTQAAFRAAFDVLADPRRPTGMFCFNDEMALGVYQAAAELGLRVGSDVCVVGFDDLPLIAPALRPGLTTMRLPHYEMAVWAVDHLLRRGEDEVEHARLECPTVERESVCSAG